MLKSTYNIYSNKGFTLIELLIVLAIIATLVTISYPSYNQYLEKSRRTDAQAALMNLANHMEHYYSENNSYESAVVPIELSPGEYYKLSIITQDDISYSLQATPQNAQANDLLCQSLTLNYLGEKGITSGPMGEPKGTINQCW